MEQEHTFDDLIRQRMEELPPGPAPAGSWEALSDKLDRAERAVDDAVARGLERSAPTTVSGWAALAARLELIGRRREMVGCLKFTEAALLVSALLLFFRLGYFTAPSTPSAVKEEATGIAAELPPSGASDATAPAATAPLDLAPPVQTTATASGERRRAGASVRVTAPLTADEQALLPVRSTVTAPATRRPAVPAVKSINTLSTDVHRLTTGAKPSVSLPILPPRYPVNYALNFFISPLDLNQVVTLDNPTLGLERQTALTSGQSLGLLFEAEQGRNGLQVGFIYGRRSYKPTEIKILESDTLLNRGLDAPGYGRLTYHTLSIPLNYQYSLPTIDDKWRISAGVGMSMNVILSGNFELAGGYTKNDLERLVFLALDNRNNGPRGQGREARDVRDVVNPSPGLLDDGHVLNNASLYLNSHLRVERLLNDRWSLYFSPTFTRLLTLRNDDGGKGPLEDRIHNTMLQMGTRLQLGKR